MNISGGQETDPPFLILKIILSPLRERVRVRVRVREKKIIPSSSAARNF
jgi:hypothetical protein